MGKVIRITPASEITVHEWPEADSLTFLQGLVGGFIERVTTPRLQEMTMVRGLSGRYCMLADEESVLKGLVLNLPASWLSISNYFEGKGRTRYPTNPIFGPVVILAEAAEDFMPIPDEEFERVYQMLTNVFSE